MYSGESSDKTHHARGWETIAAPSMLTTLESRRNISISSEIQNKQIDEIAERGEQAGVR